MNKDLIVIHYSNLSLLSTVTFTLSECCNGVEKVFY